MTKTVALPEDLYRKAAEFAARGRQSVDEFVSALIAGSLESREVIEPRAKRFNRADFEAALSSVPDREPDDHDRL